LLDECRGLGGCPTGEVRLTKGYRLPARFVIHAVGPVWHGGGRDEDRLLAGCYHGAIELAARHGLTSIAFPAISTGVYGFPPERAAPIAVGTVKDALAAAAGIREVIFCCFSPPSAELHRQALAALGK